MKIISRCFSALVLGIVSLAGCSASAPGPLQLGDSGSVDASTSPIDSADSKAGSCQCSPPTAANPVECPKAFGVHEVMGKPCSAIGRACEYVDDSPTCLCSVKLTCVPDPRSSDAGVEDGGDGGSSGVWEPGR